MLGSRSAAIRLLPGLNERRMGVLEGRTKADIIGSWGNRPRKHWRDDPRAVPPGGESIEEVAERVLAVWHGQINADLCAGGTALVVAHHGPLRAILEHLDQDVGPIGNGQLIPLRGGQCCADTYIGPTSRRARRDRLTR